MKSRSKELLDRAIAAMMAAIEVYNKPNFFYREETFAILAINGWELLLKAKWLSNNQNKLKSLYVYESLIKKNGEKGKRQTKKLTRSGNPFTHNIEYLAKKFIEKKEIENAVWLNIIALIEIRDSAVHFYNFGNSFSVRLQEIGVASIKNFVGLVKKWFDRDLSEFNFYIMPLSFILLSSSDTVVLNKEENKFLRYIESLDDRENSDNSDFSVTVKINVNFVKSKDKSANSVRISNDPNATEIRLTEENIKDRYPWDYRQLITECKNRYSDFSVTKKFHNFKKQQYNNSRFCYERIFYPGNPKSNKTHFYNPSIMNEFDKHYQKK